MLHLKNEEAVIVNIPKPSRKDQYEEEKKKKELEEKINPTPSSPTRSPTKKEDTKFPEEEKHHAGKEGGGGSKGGEEDKDGDSDFKKHESFEPWLQAYLKSQHFPPVIEHNFKVKTNCTGHPPYPRSVCSKCMP